MQLYCIMLYRTACVIVYFIDLHLKISNCTMLHHLLHSIMLFYTIPYCFIMDHTSLVLHHVYWIGLHHIVLHCRISLFIVLNVIMINSSIYCVL